MIDELELTTAHAKAIVEKGIEFEVYSEEMPETDKDIQEAAHDIVSFAIDSYVDDEVRPDSDDEEVAEAGEQIMEIFALAGIKVDRKNNVKFGKLPEIEDEEEEDDEAAFDIDDYIDGYDELTAASKVKAIKALELDPEDEDDEAVLGAIHQHESEQDKPAGRVLSHIEDLIGEPEESEDDEEEVDSDAVEEPWEGYDDSSVKDIKEALTGAADDDDDPLTADQLESVIAYEEGSEKPRSSLVKWMNELLELLNEGDDEEEEGDDEDAEDEEDGEEIDLDELDRKELKALIKDNELDIKVTTSMTDDDIRAAINEAIGEDEEEEGDEEEEEGDEEEIEISEEALNELEKEDLAAVAEQFEIEFPKRLTGAGKKRVIAEILEAAGDGDEEDDEEEEEKPAKKGTSKRGKSSDPDDSDDVDEAVAKDNRKDARKSKGGKLVITRDQILEALESGEVEIDLA